MNIERWSLWNCCSMALLRLRMVITAYAVSSGGDVCKEFYQYLRGSKFLVLDFAMHFSMGRSTPRVLISLSSQHSCLSGSTTTWLLENGEWGLWIWLSRIFNQFFSLKMVRVLSLQGWERLLASCSLTSPILRYFHLSSPPATVVRCSRGYLGRGLMNGALVLSMKEEVLVRCKEVWSWRGLYIVQRRRHVLH